MSRNWSRRFRGGAEEPSDSKRRRESRERERQSRETEGLIRPVAEVDRRTVREWRLVAQHRLAPCGKSAMTEVVARELATRLTGEGHRRTAYRCREHACWVFGHWHLRDEAKAQQRRHERRKVNGYRLRKRARDEVPLRTWDDDGGAGQATWVAQGITTKLDRLAD